MRALIVVTLLLAACAPAGASPSAAPTTKTLNGTLALHGRAAAIGLTACSGTGGYDDIAAGAQVTVKDQTGTLIGTGSLEAGKANAERTTCTFAFKVADLPDATFYAIEVSHRGELTYSAAEMETRHWVVAFTLGD